MVPLFQSVLVLFFLAFTGGIVESDEVDFGKECPAVALPDESVDCQFPLAIDCQNIDSLTGAIFSPDFPLKVTNVTRFGKYKLIIQSCDETTITLTLNRTAFLLGPVTNTFTVGDGDVVGENVIEPRLDAGIWNLNVTEYTLNYISSGKSIWMEADMSLGSFWFYITYTISNVNEQTTIESTSVTSEDTTWESPTISTEDTTTESLTMTSEDPTTEITTVASPETTSESPIMTSDDTTTTSSTISSESTTSKAPTVSTTTSRTSTTTSPNYKKPCNQIDPYGVPWSTNITEVLDKSCSLGVLEAEGTAFWTCNCDSRPTECFFETSQPDFSNCKGSELETIIDSVNNDTATVTEIWMAIANFTSQEDKYYGQEIFEILIGVVTALLDRMQREMDGAIQTEPIEFLTIQINIILLRYSNHGPFNNQ